MLWVLIRSTSPRLFKWVPTTYSSRNKKNIMWLPPLTCSYAFMLKDITSPFYYLLMQLKYYWMSDKLCTSRSDAPKCFFFCVLFFFFNHTMLFISSTSQSYMVCLGLSVWILKVNTIFLLSGRMDLYNIPISLSREKRSWISAHFCLEELKFSSILHS